MDKTYIHQLIERYFEGETSRSEEMELKQFLCSPEARDPEFDEVKAVMGFVETARAVRRPSAVYPLHGRTHIRRWVAAAGLALLLAAGGGSAGWYMYNLRAHNECVAYINGEKYTNPGVVMERMRQTMQSVLPGERERRMSPEAQLKDLFRTSEESSDGVEVIVSGNTDDTCKN